MSKKSKKRCMAIDIESGKRCERLAIKNVGKFRDDRKGYVCSRHYREFKRELQVEHVLGKTEDEAMVSMERKIQEYDSLPGDIK